MFLLAGLGNPGSQYAKHRHNVGFMAVDEIAHCHSLGPWKKKFQAQICEGKISEQKVLVMKPETYMNESGRAVGEAARFYKIPLSNIFVFYDELDLAPGKIKLKLGGGIAGHNGPRSISSHIGNDYYRVRIGIGHPGKHRVTQWVLGDFAKSDQDWLYPLLDAIGRDSTALVTHGAERFQTDIALRLRPERAETNRKKNNKPSPAPVSSKSDAKNKITQPSLKNAMAESLMKLLGTKKD